MPNHRSIRGAILFVALFSSGGCGMFARKEPPPFVAPRGVTTDLTHFAGSPLSGPTTRPIASVAPDQALAVRVRFVLLEKMPAAGTPLSGAARLIAADRLGTPVLPSNRLTRAARIIDLPEASQFERTVGAQAGRTAAISEQRGALPRGVTATFEISDPSPLNPQLAAPGAAHRLELLVYRPLPSAKTKGAPASQPASGESIELAVVVEDLAPLPREVDRTEDAGKETPPAPADVAQRELAIIDRPLTEHDAAAIVLPFRLADSSGQAVAVVIEISHDPGSPEHLAALSRTIEDGRRSAERAAMLRNTLVGESDAGSGLNAALQQVGASDHRRAAVVYLAGRVGAKLCEDVALVADEATLATLAERVKAAATSKPPATTSPSSVPGAVPPLNSETVGWQLERVTFDLLAQLLGDNKLSPELESVLVVHTGEAGRHPSSLEEIRGSMATRNEYQRRLIDENLIYLEDSAPSARVRAFDWLTARKRAPAGYDPLGTPRDRRVAIEQYLNNPSTAPSP